MIYLLLPPLSIVDANGRLLRDASIAANPRRFGSFCNGRRARRCCERAALDDPVDFASKLFERPLPLLAIVVLIINTLDADDRMAKDSLSMEAIDSCPHH